MRKRLFSRLMFSRQIVPVMLVAALLCGLLPLGNVRAVEMDLSGTTLTYAFKQAAAYPMDTTYENTGNTWRYIANTSNWTPNSSANSLLSDSMQLKFDTLGQWMALEINVPNAGRYRATLTYRQAYYGAVAETYFMPSTTDIVAGMTSDHLLGEANYYSYNGSGGNNAALSDVEVPTAGTYLLVFRLKTYGPMEDGPYIYPGVLTLDGTAVNSVKLSASKTTLEPGALSQANVSATLASGAALDLSKIAVSYTSSDTNIATVDKSSGLITAVSAGTTRISASITLDGNTYSPYTDINVQGSLPYSGQTVSYAFKQSAQYAMNTTYENTGNTWKYLACTSGWTPDSANSPLSDSVQLKFDTLGQWVALELNVPAAGRYRAKLTYRGAYYGAVAETYFMPSTTDIQAGMTSDHLIGEADYYNYNGSGGNEVMLEEVNAPTAGSYILVFRLKAYGPMENGPYIYPSALTLDGSNTTAVMTLGQGSLVPGDMTSAAVTVTTASGSTLDLSNSTISYTSSASAIASVDEYGNITAKTLGSATITANITLDGKTYTAISDITVREAMAYSGKTAVYDFSKAATYPMNTTYENTANMWKYATHTIGWTPSTSGNNVLSDSVQFQFSKLGDWVALELDVPAAGRYRAMLTYRGAYYGAVAETYFMPATNDVEAGLISSNRIGETNYDDYYGSGGKLSPQLDVEASAAGKYYLVFRITNYNSREDGAYIYPSKLTLDGSTEGVVSLHVSKTSLILDETATASITTSTSSGGTMDLSGAVVRYQSSAPDVAEVDSSTGAITAHNQGFTKITVTVSKGTMIRNDTKIVTVRKPLLYPGDILNYEFKNAAAYPMNTTYEQTDNTWKYATNKSGWTPSTSGNSVLSDSVQFQFDKLGDWVALELNVPAAGRYRPVLTYRGAYYGAIAETYFIAATDNVEAALTSENLIGEVDYYNYNGAGGNLASLSEVEAPTAGKYYLVFRAKTYGLEDQAYIYPSKLTLDGSQIGQVTVSLSEEQIGPGESTSAAVSATLGSGDPLDLSDAEVIYSSSDPGVAQVDEQTGVITAVAAGSAQITATVRYSGAEKNAVATIQVDPQYRVERLLIKSVDTITLGTKGQAKLTGVQNNGKEITVSLDGALFELLSSTPEGAAALEDGGVVSGIALGTAELRATATCRGRQLVSEVCSVSVQEAKKATAVVQYSLTSALDTDVRKLTQYGDRNWAYLSDTVSMKNGGILQMVSCFQVVSEVGEWVALKVKIPEQGQYHAKMEYLGISGAGYVDLYLLPMTDEIVNNIGANLSSAYKFGRLDGFAQETETLTQDVGDLYAPTAGDYIMVMRSAGKNENGWGTYMYPRSIYLYGEGALSSVTLGLENGSTEVEIGKSAQLTSKVLSVRGSEVDLVKEGITPSFTTSNPKVLSVDKNGVLTANAIGSAQIGVTISNGSVVLEDTQLVEVTDYSDVQSVELTGVSTVWVRGTAQLSASAKMSSGNTITIPNSALTYTMVSCDPEGAATVSETGLITGIAQSTLMVKGTANFRGKTYETPVLTLPVSVSSKKKSTIWTDEKKNNIRENANKYQWAKDEVDEVKKKADRYVDEADTLWNLIVPEGLPRYYHVGQKYDPEKFYCRYCGTDLQTQYGSYPFITDPLNKPWKIQCPSCKRSFPSNDFGKYYNAGLDEHGIFDPAIAKANGQEYLKNILYPEKGEGWGVDDGFGYLTGRTYANGVVERHNYIAYYLHEGLWYDEHGEGVITDAINQLALAYTYTGDAKYGRTGAILLDRVADFYPGFDWYQWHNYRPDDFRGKILDPVWESQISLRFAKAYDAFFPIYEDSQVISFLSEKAKKYKMENPKNSPSALRANVENGLLREIYDACVKGKIAGNFGMTQATLTAAALALDTMPETGEWLEWLMRQGEMVQTGDPTNANRKGGNILPKLVNTVNRDGTGNEAAPGYNMLWVTQLIDVAEMLRGYDTYSNFDLYKNPKFAKMFTGQIPLTMAGYYTEQIGDSGGTATAGMVMKYYLDTTILGFNRLKTPELAQLIYLFNGNSVKGIHGDITEPNPEKIQQEIMDVINTKGTFAPTSEMMPSYGFAVLRGGSKYDSAGVNASVNTLRDFSIYFGRGIGHGHHDALHLGVDAFGLNMGPDLGYPEQTGYQPNDLQWVRSTLSHNTVMVDGKIQTPITTQGTPLHFDDSGRVQLMDISAPEVYSTTTIYRRTMVMVEASDEVSYGIDFFRVKGGDDHRYSFHSQSDEIFETEGLTLAPQVDTSGNYVGTYAGENIPWGPDPNTNVNSASYDQLQCPPGTTWLYNVNRDNNPKSTFAVDFKVKDFNRILSDSSDLHLRLTMLSDDPMTDVVVATGNPPNLKDNKNIPGLKYMIAHKKGSALDTLFTTVYEPYQNTRYLESMTAVPISVLSGTPGADDTAKAVKVTHKSGRIDYVVYTTNNSVKYRVDDLFDFRGFVGVYSLKDGQPIYTYLNDGDTIGDSTGNLSSYTGTVKDFTRELTRSNNIIIRPDQTMNIDNLPGRYIYIQNTTSAENGIYRILGAKYGLSGDVVLDIGDVTLIREYRDSSNLDLGYRYNIESGQKYKILLSTLWDDSPVFTPISLMNVNAKSNIRFMVSATSPVGRALTYRAVSLPRGASFDPATKVFIWTPDSNQVGRHHVAIEVTDGTLTSTQHMEIQVLTGVSGGTTMVTPSNGNSTGNETQGNTGIVTPPTQEPGTTTSEGRFRDLGNFQWAKDAIGELAEAGIIRGTSADTFSPQLNIKRADFAILLVRALKLTGSDAEQFKDVPADAYYAEELAVAHTNNIINGQGGNKFNPTGKITREDMMVIAARALAKAGVTLPESSDDTLSAFSDSVKVSDYAKLSVAALVKAGVISGSDGRLNLKGKATRAEVVVMLKRILGLIQK